MLSSGLKFSIKDSINLQLHPICECFFCQFKQTIRENQREMPPKKEIPANSANRASQTDTEG